VKVLQLTEGGEFDAEALWQLLREGHVDVLIGQSESAYLEVKALGYDLSSLAQKIELAQDVARFANGDVAGLLVIGLAEKKVGAAKRVIRGPVQRFSSADAHRYHKAIDARVHPPIEGLVIQPVPAELRGDLLCIFVPAQPRHLKPFLVHGAIINARTEGAFISIVRRRGEHSIPVTPQAIHGALAAGLALLSASTERSSKKQVPGRKRSAKKR
jgi:hypothetical protein